MEVNSPMGSTISIKNKNKKSINKELNVLDTIVTNDIVNEKNCQMTSIKMD